MISFVLLLFVQAAIAASPTNSSNQRQGSSQTQDGSPRRVQSGSPRRNSSECAKREIDKNHNNAQPFTCDQKTSSDTVCALGDKIDNFLKSDKGIVIAICILGGIIALLIVLFIVILFWIIE